jgi:hypothetical protein
VIIVAGQVLEMKKNVLSVVHMLFAERTGEPKRLRQIFPRAVASFCKKDRMKRNEMRFVALRNRIAHVSG